MLGNKTALMDVTGKLHEAHYEVVSVHSPVVHPSMMRDAARPELRQRKNAEDAENYKPELVINDNPFPHAGPPVLGPDMIVEAGTRRTDTARLLANTERYAGYKERLVAMAPRFGFDPDEVKSWNTPFLVRMRDTVMPEWHDRMRFAALANYGPDDITRASITAVRDQRNFSGLLKRLMIPAGSTIPEAIRDSPQNRETFRSYCQRLSIPDLNGIISMGEDGDIALTDQGERRLLAGGLSDIITDPMLLFEIAEGI